MLMPKHTCMDVFIHIATNIMARKYGDALKGHTCTCKTVPPYASFTHNIDKVAVEILEVHVWDMF